MTGRTEEVEQRDKGDRRREGKRDRDSGREGGQREVLMRDGQLESGRLRGGEKERLSGREGRVCGREKRGQAEREKE